MRRFARLIVGLVLACLLVWCGGLLWFIRLADRLPAPPPAADGIVALTGGADRVETALRLLAEGRAPLLLVSGGGGSAELGVLARRAGLDPGPLAAEVTLGRVATTTRGNAAETADWARAHSVRSLIVVTGYYHMPRALTELSRAMPGVALHPVPVVPAALQGDGTEGQIARLRLLVAEYTKFIAAELGLSGLAGRVYPHAA